MSYKGDIRKIVYYYLKLLNGHSPQPVLHFVLSLVSDLQHQYKCASQKKSSLDLPGPDSLLHNPKISQWSWWQVIIYIVWTISNFITIGKEKHSSVCWEVTREWTTKWSSVSFIMHARADLRKQMISKYSVFQLWHQSTLYKQVVNFSNCCNV